jgi:SAM-dependent methyltransferase
MTEYEDAADPVSLREEQGQVESARRALARIERTLAPGRMVDLGSWTGSFLVAAAGRGWDGVGIEPSAWAAAQARGRGVQVFERDLFQHALAPGSFRLAVLCDVLEHLVRPGAGLCTIRDLLEPGGGLYLTIPNAGSFLARLLGRHWWSVLPMHLQYFTPSSLRRLLEAEGFEVAWMRTHAKAFTARYYGERLGGYSPALAAGATRALDLVGLADRMVAPDFRDRLAALAIRR